jgi:hypothetical protein|tara:strand:+ start:434 stop:3115 length:2682 start_codon:yes stop_codon:yes gene_type:complete
MADNFEIKFKLDDGGLERTTRALIQTIQSLIKNVNTTTKGTKKLSDAQKHLVKSNKMLHGVLDAELPKRKQQNDALKRQIISRDTAAKKIAKEKAELNRLNQELSDNFQTQLDIERLEKQKADEKQRIQDMKQRTAVNAALNKQREKSLALAKKEKLAEKELAQTQKLVRIQIQQMSAAVKASGTTFKKLGINLNTVGLALKGNSRALGQMSKAMSLANIKTKQLSKGMFSLTNNGRLLDNSFATIRSKLLLVSFAFGLVSNALVRQVRMFATQEKSVLQMARVFGTDGAKALDKYSSELQKVTRFGDETINILMSQIGSFGANVEQTKELTKATLNLSEGLGIDLNTAGLLVAKTFGSSTNALSRYGIEVDSNMTKQEKLQAVTQGINDKFEGLAELLRQTTEGQLDATSNAIGDLQERIGEALAPTVLSIARNLEELADAMPLKAIRALMGAALGLGTAFITGRVAVVGYNAATTAYNVVTSLAIIKTKGLQAALLTLNKSMKSKGIMALISLLGTGIGTLLALRNETDDMNESQDELNKRIDEYAKKMGIKGKIDKDEIKSILETVDAYEKEIKVLQAQMQFSGATLEIKKKEIDLGRTLTEAEQNLIREKHNLLQVQALTNEEIQKEENLMNLIIGAYNSTAEAQFNKLDADIKLLEKKKENNELSLEEIKGLELQKQKLAELEAQKESDAANERMRFVVLSKTATDKMKIYSQLANGFASLNEASKGSALVTARLQQIAAVIDAISAASSAAAEAPFGMKTAAAAAQYAMGMARVVQIEQSLSKMNSVSTNGGQGQIYGSYAEGGYVGGRPHSEGGTIIEAERGEFVMSRNAVESIGLETLNQMNQGGGGANINVNVSGNVMTQDFVEGELAESIKEAVRRGSDFGIN